MKREIVIPIIAFISGAAIAIGFTPTKVKIETKTIEVEKKTETKDIDKKKDTHKKTVTTVSEKPDGTKETTTVATEDSTIDTSIDIKKDSNTATSSETSKEVVKGGSKTTIALLGGLRASHFPGEVLYGIAVGRQILGPISIGAFALTPDAVGVSIGLIF